MKNEKYLKELLTNFEQHKPLKIVLTEGNVHYDTFHYDENTKRYQGDFGYLSMEDMLLAINGKLTHLKIEVA